MGVDVMYLAGDDGCAYMAKGHVDLGEFKKAINEDSYGLFSHCTPKHIWLRTVYNFQEERTEYMEAKPNSRGAFKATWVDESDY